MPISTNNYQTIAAGSSYTVPGTASDERILVAIPFINKNEEREATDVRIGGTSMTLVGTSHHLPGGDLNSAVFILKEASIPSGAQTVDVDFLDTVGAGAGETNTNESKAAVVLFTMYGVDQVETPGITSNSVERGMGDLNSENLTLTYPANAGDFGVGAVLVSREKDETHSVSVDVGTLVGEGDASGLNGNFATQSVFNKIVSISSLSGSDQTIFTCDYTNSDTVAGSMRGIQSFGLSFAEFGGTPVITVTQPEIVPGGTISGTYSNFTPGTAPTSPLTLSDGTNQITVAVSINDSAGDGTGTFTGTMPSLPAAGNSSNLVLFGSVTATLDDA